MEGLGLLIQDLAAYLYADYGLVALTKPERLHRLFDVLVSLFGQAGLRTNMQKTVSMAFYPFHAPGRMLVEADERRTMGTEPKF